LGRPNDHARDHGKDTDAVEDPPFKALSREEAQALRDKASVAVAMAVVGSQAFAGVVCAVLTWVITQRDGAAWSALYGAAVTAIPSACWRAA